MEPTWEKWRKRLSKIIVPRWKSLQITANHWSTCWPCLQRTTSNTHLKSLKSLKRIYNRFISILFLIEYQFNEFYFILVLTTLYSGVFRLPYIWIRWCHMVWHRGFPSKFIPNSGDRQNWDFASINAVFWVVFFVNE